MMRQQQSDITVERQRLTRDVTAAGA